MAIIGTLPLTLTNGTLEDATQVMTLFSWIQSQTNGNACPATAGSNILKGNGAGGTTAASSVTDYVPPGANSTITSLTGLTTPLGVAYGGTGATTFTAAGLLVGNGTAAVGTATAAQIVTAIGATAVTNATNATTATNVAGGGAGQIPYQTGSGTTSMIAAGTSTQVLLGGATPAFGALAMHNYQVFTVTGANTWTKPSGVSASSRTLVEAWGGGGGGSGASGGAGGGGVYACKWFLTSTLGATETATVGTGGGTATAGGNSTFGTWLTAYGGGGGASGGPGGGGGGGGLGAGANGSGVSGGAGGTGYTPLDAGGAGGDSTTLGAVSGGYGGGGGGSYGHAGGNSYYGGGGGSGNATDSGASFYGGSGGTSVSPNGVAPGGGGFRTGTGARGEIRVTVFI